MSEPKEPIQDIAHLGHVEILTPKPDESLRFFADVLGMHEVARRGRSVYLRGWGDYDCTTFTLTESDRAGLGHAGWRAVSPQALERRARALEATGRGMGWIDGDVGHGPAYQFTDPDGHRMEVYYESEKYRAPDEWRSKLKNQPQKYAGRGVGVQRLDHVNLMCRDVTANKEFLQEHLGFKLREHIVLDNGVEAGAWVSVSQLVHDIAYTRDFTGNRGRLHHAAFWLDNREDVLRAADILTEHEVFIETGPAKHSITQAFFLYLYEPGGNRIELFSGGYLIFAPDWEPVTWSEAERGTGVYWGGALPESFKIYGTPVVAAPVDQRPEVPAFDPQ